MEREANVFVDELLMLTRDILCHKYNARKVAEIYEVSAQAAYNKIAYLKENALYKEIYTPISDPRYESVEQLRNACLDPDYMIGGF